MPEINLFTIRFSHHAPKDGKRGIETYVLADSETAVRDRIDEEFNGGAWKDDDEPIETYDDDYDVTGEETRLERVLRLRGEVDGEDNDYSDSYYGLTFWGWDEAVSISEDDAATLLRLGIAVDWREPEAARA